MYTKYVEKVDIALKPDNPEKIYINDIIEKLSLKIPLENYSISYLIEDETSKEIYLNMGVFPFERAFTLPLNLFDFKEGKYILCIKLRRILNDNLMLCQEIHKENLVNIEETPKNTHIDSGAKRAKERKIGYMIKKVYTWKLLNKGLTIPSSPSSPSHRIMVTLQDAADAVGISKKSLDDYLIQLRVGRVCGFNFDEHQNDKLGVLRTFVKKNKSEYWRIKMNREKKN